MRGLLLGLFLTAALALGGENETLQKVANKWAPRFAMGEWKITVRTATKMELAELCGADCLGYSEWLIKSRTGVILVLKASEYSAQNKADAKKEHLGIAADQRNTVVHEFIHCIWGFMREEYAVQIITGLLRP